MYDSRKSINLSSCRVCLSSKKPLCPLFRYKLSGNYAEMLTAIADVKVLSNDGLPEKICHKCCTSLEKAYLLKSIAERTDRKLRTILAKAIKKVPTKKIAFDSFKDIKSEIGPLSIKTEPVWEMEINVEPKKSVETIEGKDIVIANTVIRKVDPELEETKGETNDNEKVDISWTKTTNDNFKAEVNTDEDDVEYVPDDIYNDDDDDDYVPPTSKKNRFKKPKLCDIKVFKGKKAVVRKVKVLQTLDDMEQNGGKSEDGKSRSTTITCYPIMKNGARGPPILLKRPKDATVLKVHPDYRSKNSGSSDGNRIVRREKTVRVVRSQSTEAKKKEKLVCPVCGILTYTLGNHLATHDEKKKFSCNQCTKSFIQKSNLVLHMKQHSGIKDHICEICGAGFYTQKSLIRHNLIHKGERPFSCHLCTKKFIARCDLNRHLRIHAGYKPYKCSECSMSFNAKHQLQNHERMHTGERPYTCEVCNVAFSYKVNLNNHVQKAHGLNFKFKSIHRVTEEVLRREMGMANETSAAIAHILPHLTDVPTPAAHETVHHTAEY
ncbi:PREDICTED: zinc finger protein 25-like [Papilio xuthus]|uniref:Zinc finger protein 25-like n=1 Tax=Papilio xuthus TaxID=66420 RepID=A0AAJ6ZRV2_PAPXU|nr:PREDICTED: zinc finger protein 25-like [Papilio xuthus]